MSCNPCPSSLSRICSFSPMSTELKPPIKTRDTSAYISSYWSPGHWLMPSDSVKLMSTGAAFCKMYGSSI